MSTILKNKYDQIPHISKKLKSDNTFVFKNIVVQNKMLDSNCELINKLRLNNGFIMEANSCKVEQDQQKSKSNGKVGNSNTDSRSSIPSLNLNNQSKHAKQEIKIQELNKKIEVMKPSVSKVSKEMIENGEKLTCFQKFCGAGKR
jgi:hypothetical protein